MNKIQHKIGKTTTTTPTTITTRETQSEGGNIGNERHNQSENEPVPEGHVEDVIENEESSEDEEVAVDPKDDGADTFAVDGDSLSSDPTSEDEADEPFTVVESKRAKRNSKPPKPQGSRPRTRRGGANNVEKAIGNVGDRLSSGVAGGLDAAPPPKTATKTDKGRKGTKLVSQ